jgi:outer membrane protein
MKKLFLIAFAVVSFISCETQKTGYINTEKVLKEYKGTKDLQAEVKTQTEAYQKEIDVAIANFQNKVVAYQKGANKMSAKKRAGVEQGLGQEQQAIQQRQQEAKNKIQIQEQDGYIKVAKDLKAFVKKYAKKNGYNMILGTVELNGSVLYGDENNDLTDTLLDEFNKSYYKGGDSDNSKDEPKKDEKKEDEKPSEDKK